MTRKFAVFGNPIKQSLSPQIHQNFAQQHKLDISYERILSEEDRFSDDLQAFFANGGIGCNVTAPFKQLAFSQCNELTEDASRAQAVNTLYKTDAGKLCGHNTDGIGLLKDLSKNLRSLQNHNVSYRQHHSHHAKARPATECYLCKP